MLGVSVGVVVLGWVLFGLGVGWGVHGNVVSATGYYIPIFMFAFPCIPIVGTFGSIL